MKPRERRSVQIVHGLLQQLIHGGEDVLPVPKIANATGLTVRSVQYALDLLERAGRIARVQLRKGGPNRILLKSEATFEPLPKLVARAFKPVEDITLLWQMAHGDEVMLRKALDRLADRPPSTRVPECAGFGYFAAEVREELRRLRFGPGIKRERRFSETGLNPQKKTAPKHSDSKSRVTLAESQPVLTLSAMATIQPTEASNGASNMLLSPRSQGGYSPVSNMEGADVRV